MATKLKKTNKTQESMIPLKLNFYKIDWMKNKKQDSN